MLRRLPAHRVCRSSPPGRRSGFALLITITLLAFLVLLLVALSSLTRVETQVTSNAQALTLARQNALMALNIALGQLQLADGPDQRTSAPAVLGENATAVMAANSATNGLGPVNGPGTAYWTGVWGNLNTPAAIFTNPQPAGAATPVQANQPVLLQWLVSGNEQTPAPVAATDGHITSPATAAATQFNPSQSVISPALSASTTPATSLTITGRSGQAPQAVLLLGNNTAGANTTAYVAAPVVPISVASGSIPGLSGSTSVPVGHYAWWVGDEGVKAKYNVPDPYLADATPDTGSGNTSIDSRYRAQVSQRNGIELVNTSYNPLAKPPAPTSGADANGFSGANYPVATTSPADPLYIGVGNTLTPAGMLMTSGATSLGASAVLPATLQLHEPDLTTYSYGVLADSQFGGLRRDLTFHLDPQSGDTFLLGRDILPDGNTTTVVANGQTYPPSTYQSYASQFPSQSVPPSLFSDTIADGGMALTTPATSPAAPLNISPLLGPKWDQVASFYQLAYGQPNVPSPVNGQPYLDVQPAVGLPANPIAGQSAQAVAVQAGVSPVILSVRLLFSLATPSSIGSPAIGTSLILVLGNPYSRPLTSTKGIDLRLSLHPTNYNITTYVTPEFGLVGNFVDGPGWLPSPQVTSMFTRLPVNGVNKTVPTQSGYPTGGLAYQVSYLLSGNTLPPSTSTALTTPPQYYFGDYYPILKWSVPYDPRKSLSEGGDYPKDPDDGYPGLLDQVVFQIPAGALNIPPGQAVAYTIDPTATNMDSLSSEWIAVPATAGGISASTPKAISFSIVPLNVLSSATPTYCWASLMTTTRKYYLSKPFQTLLNNPAEQATTGSGSYLSTSFTTSGETRPQIDYTLTVADNTATSGNPNSSGNPSDPTFVLQQWNGWDPENTDSSISTLGTGVGVWPFASTPSGSPALVAFGLGHDLRPGESATHGPYQVAAIPNYGPFDLGAAFVERTNIATTGPMSTTGYINTSMRQATNNTFWVPSTPAVTSNPTPYYVTSVAASSSFAPIPSFTANLNTGAAGGVQRAWGQSGLENASSQTGGLVLSDVPAVYAPSEIPILSLGQLQHVDLTADDEVLGVDIETGNAVGNSWYDLYLPRNLSIGYPTNAINASSTILPPTATAPTSSTYNNARSEYGASLTSVSNTALGETPLYPGYAPLLPWQTPIRFFDISYLLNAALWDSTFFSTVRPAAGNSATVAPTPANQRLVYAGSPPTLGQLRGSAPSGAVANPSALLPGENGLVPAALMMINGAFNVNSTSVEAWTALLAGLRGLAVNGSPAVATQTPFPRSICQPGAVQSTLPLSQTTDPSYTGFRALTDAQIASLAQAIVAQVEARGPFLSLSQFINRNLTPAAATAIGNTGVSGALQQAIDSSGSNLNNGLGTASSPTSLTAPPLYGYSATSFYPDDKTVPTNSVPGLSVYMGAPGWLTQADVLQAIGPVLSARSDTFVIRTYGDVVNPATGAITGRAWCEAVVQRTPQYVDPSNQPTMNPSNPNFTAINRSFGRRFKIVSFRWLSPSDI